MFVDAHELARHLEHEAFYSHVLTLKIDGKEESVVLRDIQRHPSKSTALHIDLLRVSEGHAIKVHVPLHFIGQEECVGVKQDGGVVNHLQTDVEVSCLPKDLPEFIEVDITQLHLGNSLHLSDIIMPQGVSLIASLHGDEADIAVVSVFRPRTVEQPATEEPGEQPEAAEESVSDDDG